MHLQCCREYRPSINPNGQLVHLSKYKFLQPPLLSLLPPLLMTHAAVDDAGNSCNAIDAGDDDDAGID